MVILIVPYPCGTIFSIILIISGILTLPTDPGSGISLIVVGVVLLGINQVLMGSSRPRGAPMMNRTPTSFNRSYNRSYSGGIQPKTAFICPQCNVEYRITSSNSLCPICQVPLESKSSEVVVQETRTNYYFDE